MTQVYTSITLPFGFGELPSSPTEHLTEKGWEAAVEMVVPWDLRGQILEDIIGNQKLYPHLYGRTAAYAISGGSKPYQNQAALESSAKDSAAYTAAHLTIRYGRDHNNKDTKGEEVFSESINFTDQHLELEPTTYQWNHTGKTMNKPERKDGPTVVIMKGFEYTQVRYNQVAVPNFMDLMGSVNSAPYYCSTLGITIPAESLLFNPPQLSRKVMSSGIAKWTVTYKITGKLPSWNQHWNPKGNTVDANGTPTGVFNGAWEYMYTPAHPTTPVKLYIPKAWTSIFV